MATEALTIKRSKLMKMDEQLTAKTGETRQALAAVEDKLLQLTVGQLDESNIDIIEENALLEDIQRTTKVVLQPCGNMANLGVRKLINHQLDSTGQSQNIINNSSGLRIFNMTTGSQIDISTIVGETPAVEFELPERMVIEQKLWKSNTVGVGDVGTTFGYYIFTDSDNAIFSSIVGAQLAPPLFDSPNDGCEIITTGLSKTQFINNITSTQSTRDITGQSLTFQNFGLVARELRDIDIPNGNAGIAQDPTIANLVDTGAMSATQLSDIISAASAINVDGGDTTVNQSILYFAAQNGGLWSTSLGPVPNPNYSDFKRFIFNDGSPPITCSMALICYNQEMTGIKKRKLGDGNTKANRASTGLAYIQDFGGVDSVIRAGQLQIRFQLTGSTIMAQILVT